MSSPHVGWLATISAGSEVVALRVTAGQRTTQDQLLHVAAGQCARRRIEPAAADVESVAEHARIPARRLRRRMPALANGRR